MTAVDTAAALQAYDEQIRRSTEAPVEGATVEWSGPVLRLLGPPDLATAWANAIVASELDESTADAAIAEQVGFFGELGRAFEWKWHGYDQPADLRDRLSAAGFVPDEQETLVVGEVAEVAAACAGASVLDEVTLRHLRPEDADAEFAAIAGQKGRVWGEDFTDLMSVVRAEWESEPDRLLIHVAEARGEVVCSAWVRLHPGTDFASLWGGGTLPEWRRKGIYRALVGRRTREAQERGYRYLQVDASDDSRPILQRLGLHPLTETTPYNWSP